MLNDGHQNITVIDTLDECKEDEEEREREAFYEVLQEVKPNADRGYKIVITSRPEPDILPGINWTERCWSECGKDIGGWGYPVACSHNAPQSNTIQEMARGGQKGDWGYSFEAV